MHKNSLLKTWMQVVKFVKICLSLLIIYYKLVLSFIKAYFFVMLAPSKKFVLTLKVAHNFLEEINENIYAKARKCGKKVVHC